MAGLFEQAERTVSTYFSRRRDDPAHGTIEIFGERYLLVRAASLSVEFFSLVQNLYGKGREEEAASFARNILFDLAHALGKSDALRFHEITGVDDPIAKLAAGPIHFAHAGWAFVDIHEKSKPSPDDDYFMQFDHPYSFEADAWVSSGKQPDFPVCIMSSGYSSGWCAESFGIPLVSSEVLCRGRGDDVCRFLMGTPNRIEGYVEQYAVDEPNLAHRIRGTQIPDFFARKRMEEELHQARAELEERVIERTAELRDAYDRLRREMAAREEMEKQLMSKHKLEALGRLASGIAHDFNNLMTVVIGQSSFLERGLAEEDRLKKPLVQIRKAGERAADIARQLSAFGKTQILRSEALDLNEIVRDTLDMLQHLIGEDLELDCKYAPGPLVVTADRSQMAQVMINLVVNAREAMPAGGTLRIETSMIRAERNEVLEGIAAGSWVRLTVSDTGTGIPQEVISKIFEPFFTTKETGGTGLGLSTVYGIVEQFGGKVAVTSPEGGGARFDVMLPLADSAALEARTRVEPGELSTGDETILVVEDQAAPRAVVSDILRELGYRILEAEDAEEAIGLASQYEGEIDLLLTDVIMPRMSGPELAERLVGGGGIPRALYMSGYADHETMARGVDRTEMVSKPFTPFDLAQRVRRVLDGAPNGVRSPE